ncbi:hypothetical protein OBBRIDRAFT_808924, partial [Obba rivulosa]
MAAVSPSVFQVLCLATRAVWQRRHRRRTRRRGHRWPAGGGCVGRAPGTLEPSLQNAASSVAGGWRKPSPGNSSNPDIGSSVGRVAAAAAVFRNQNQNSNGSPPPPPAPPRRPSTGSSQDAPGHIEAQKLVPQRKFGDVDVSSAKNMFTSLRNSTVNKAATPPPVAPPTPAALPRRGGFAPPPVRRVGSTSDSGTSARSPPPPPPPRPHEPEPEGEWAEALYDYTSE